MQQNSNLSILYSGGLDSFIAWHYALKNGFRPEAYFLDFGQPYAWKEWESIQALPEDIRPPVTRLDFSTLYSIFEHKMSNQIVPSRNVFLAVLGSMFNQRVWINALDGEQNGKEHDKSMKFFQDSTNLLTFTNSFFQDSTIVETPFGHLTKAETIGWAINNNISKEHLFATTSCYDAKLRKCGKCLTCYKRKVAFMLNGIDEPGYACDPFNSAYSKELAREIPLAKENNDYSRFTKKRVDEFYQLQKIMGYL
jgi:7-cyano-7-deazaguanine synthase in queuosine biosynthesis